MGSRAARKIKMNATAKTKMFAFVAVFAMMLCAIVPMIGASQDDAAYGFYGDSQYITGSNGTYAVDIATGWTFSYPNISTNLDNISGGTVSITYAETKDNVAEATPTLTLSGRTLSGSFSEAGTYVGTLTATWTKTAGGNAMSQTATQEITFNVSAQVKIDNSKAATASAYVIADKPAASGNSTDNGTATPTAANTTIASVAFTAPGATTDTVKYTAKDGSTFTTTNPGFFTVTTNNTSTSGNITVALSRTVTNAEVGTYKIEVVKSYGTTGDSAKVTFTVNVYDGLAIITDYDHYYTYETDTHLSSGIAVTSNYTTNGASLVLDSFNVSATGTNPMSKNTSAQKIDVDTTANTYLGADVEKTFSATITMTGHLAADNTVTTTSTKTIQLTMYADLAFTSVPTSNGASITTNSNSGTSITLSSYIKGAKSVIFDWGDGIKTSTMDAGNVIGQNYSAAHTYAKTGTYLISIIAENDAGATRSQVLYNAYADEEPATPVEGDGEGDGDEPAEETKDKELKDFTLQIAMIVIGALALIIAFRFGYNYAIVVYIAAGVAILGLILAGLQFFDVCDLSNVSNDIVDFFSNLFGQKSSTETPAESE